MAFDVLAGKMAQPYASPEDDGPYSMGEATKSKMEEEFSDEVLLISFALDYPSIDAAKFEVERRLNLEFLEHESSYRSNYWGYETRDFRHTIEICPNHDFEDADETGWIRHRSHIQFPVIIEVQGREAEINRIISAFSQWPELERIA